MKRSHRKIRDSQPKFGRNERGQVVIEYMLILVVLVVMGMNFVDLFAKPFQAFTTDMLGTYTQCLLESGELPKLNNTENAECHPPSLGAGAKRADTTIRGATGSSGRDGSNGANGSNGNQGDGSSNSSSSKSSSSSSSDRAGNSGGRSASSGGRGGGRNSGRSNADGPGSSNTAKVTEIPVNGTASSEGGGFFKGSQNGYAAFNSERKKSRNINMDGYSEAEKAKFAKSVNAGTRTLASTESFMQKSKKMDFKPPKPKAKDSPDEDSGGIQFGNWLRYLFIIAIIIIIISLIGGQVAQMMKSWEK